MDGSEVGPERKRRSPLLVFGLLLAVGLILTGVFAPWLAPYDPLQPDPRVPVGLPAPPSSQHLLGTDSRARDVLSRLIHGARLSLSVGLGAMVLAVGLGTLVGVLAGYFRGSVDVLLMRLTDVVMAFPAILLALAAATVLPQRNAWTLILVIGLISWTAAARIFRSETLSLRERVYVEAARSMGASHGRILARHILPHLLPTLLVVASLSTAATILMDAGLSFLNVGVPAPAPTWGSMLLDAQQYYSVAPWLAVWPGLAVLLTVASFNLIAFELRRRESRGAKG